jgi:beta-glucosidase
VVDEKKYIIFYKVLKLQTKAGQPMDIKRLLSKMTLEEKVAQLSSAPFKKAFDFKGFKTRENAKALLPHSVGQVGRIAGSTDLLPREVAKMTNEIQRYFVEETRLNIPVLFATEATGGYLGRNVTLFPSNLNVGACFNENYAFLMGEAISKEMRSMGENWALAPVVDIIREFRYGRFEEAFSEDTFLVTRNGVNYVKGLQGEDLSTGVAACLKHYIAQGISDGGRNTGPVHLSDNEILNEYSIPFQACIKEANAATVMAAYHEISGIPCHVSKKLLTDYLRDEFGFDGFVVSDGSGISLVHNFQEFCESYEKAGTLAINAGIDMELDGVFSKYLSDEVKKGNVSEDRLNEAVLRVLKLKEDLGLFENPYVDIDKVDEIIACARHLDIAYQIAVNSIIMLENKNNTLPLSTEKKIGLVGYLSNHKDFAYGDYSYPTHVKEQIFECQDLEEHEIVARCMFTQAHTETYDELYHDIQTIDDGLKDIYSVVQRDLLPQTYNYNKDKDFENYTLDEELRSCDVFVVVVGETTGMGFYNETGESTDRVVITLSQEQRNLIKNIKALGKPVIIILSNAKPVELTLEAELCDAMLEVFKVGHMGAKAIADIISGKVSPSGKLPVTIPKHQGQCPIYYSQRITGKKQFWRDSYLEMDLSPLYEFGYGLSYTEFDINVKDFKIDNNSITAKLDIKNIGNYAGAEVIQLYVKKRYGSIAFPDKELKYYKKVDLAINESKTIDINIDIASLYYYNADNIFGIENIKVTAMLGTSATKILKEVSADLKFN